VTYVALVRACPCYCCDIDTLYISNTFNILQTTYVFPKRLFSVNRL